MAGRLVQYVMALLIVHLAAACSPSEPGRETMANAVNAVNAANAVAGDTTPAAVDGALIVAFGDSLYAGYGLAQDEGFAPVLEHALDARGIKVRVINAGVSGDTSAAGLQRLAFTLDGLARSPDLVIVGLGGNDMLRGLSPKETRANIDAILAELKKRNIPAMLTGMLAAPNMGQDYTSAFNPIYPDLAKKYDTALYPFFLDGVIGNRKLMLPDGMHPNADGVTMVVDRIAPLVADDLGEPARLQSAARR